VEGGGQIAQRMVVGLLVAQQVPLQLEVGAAAPEFDACGRARPGPLVSGDAGRTMRRRFI